MVEYVQGVGEHLVNVHWLEYSGRLVLLPDGVECSRGDEIAHLRADKIRTEQFSIRTPFVQSRLMPYGYTFARYDLQGQYHACVT